MEFSKKDRDAFNKLFAEVSNKNTSKKNKKGKRNGEKVSDCKKVKSSKGAVRDCKDFAQQQWKGLAECLEKLIKDETATECDDVPVHFACLVGLVDLINPNYGLAWCKLLKF